MLQKSQMLQSSLKCILCLVAFFIGSSGGFLYAASIYMTVMDCAGNLTSGDAVQAYLGDGYCDDGTWGIDLNCPSFNYDNGDCSGWGSGSGYSTDCVGNIASTAQIQSWLGDGYCDDGSYGLVLNCAQYNWDNGDCNYSSGSSTSYTTDCVGNTVSVAQIQSWLGDGYCDDGTYGVVLYCQEYNWDYGDCGYGGVSTGTSGGYTVDCVGNAVSVAQVQAWLGDGYCDDGTYGVVLYCQEYNWDYGDCSYGGTATGPTNNYTIDCSGNMVPLYYVQAWLGDGYCDNGQNGINLNCYEYNYDYGDCNVILY